jgi:hypothetical protein
MQAGIPLILTLVIGSIAPAQERLRPPVGGYAEQIGQLDGNADGRLSRTELDALP